MDSRLPPVLGLHRLHREAIRLPTAITTAFAYSLIDHHAEFRLSVDAAASPTALLCCALLVVHQDAHPVCPGEDLLCLLDPRPVPHRDLAGQRDTAVAAFVFGRNDDLRDTLGQQHRDDLFDPHRPDRALSAGHGDSGVVQESIGDVHARGLGCPDRQRAGVVEGSVTHVLDVVAAFDERLYPDPLKSLAAHL
jgi:hypothetical protein